MIPTTLPAMAVVAIFAAFGWTCWRWCRLNGVGDDALESLLFAGVGSFAVLSTIAAWCGLLGMLHWSTVLAGAVVVAVVLERSHSRTPPRVMSVQLTMADSALLSLFVVIALLLLFRNALYTPIDSDSMWYHLPMAAGFARAHSIWSELGIPLIATAYPAFKEVFQAATVSATGREHLAIVLSGLEIGGFGLSVLVLARRLGAPTYWAVAAASYCVVVPQVPAAAAGTDLQVATLFTTALALGVGGGANAFVGQLFLGVIAGGLCAAKYSGPGFAAIAMAVALIAPGGRRRWSWRRSVQAAAIVVGAAALVASPWYVRNVIAYGNPLYPAAVHVLGVPIFTGPVSGEWLRSTGVNFDLGLLFSRRQHFVEAFGPLVGVTAALWLAAGLLYRGPHRVGRSLVALAGVVCILQFLGQPFTKPGDGFSYNMRFLLPWFGVAVATGTALVAQAGVWVRTAASAVAIVFALRMLSSATSAWPVVVVVPLGFVGLRLLIRRTESRAIFLKPPAFRVLRVATACAAIFAVAILSTFNRHLQYDDGYGYRNAPSTNGWAQIVRYVRQSLSHETILVVGDNRIYPLYGEDLSNTVRFVPRSFILSPPMPSAGDIVREVDQTGATYIVFFNPSRPGNRNDGETHFSLGKEFSRQYADRLEVIVEADGAYLLRVRRT